MNYEAPRHYCRWQQSEDDLLRSSYGVRPLHELCQILDRGAEAVTKRARKLGLCRKLLRPWTAGEDALTLSRQAVPGRTPAAVRARRSVLKRFSRGDRT